MSDLLDRSVGSLTLRELASLAKAAQTMSAALEAEALPVAAEPVPSRLTPDRPTVADGIRAVVAGKPLPKAPEPPRESRQARTNGDIRRERKTADQQAITDVRAQLDREAAERPRGGTENGAPKKGPGSGRRFCPKCHEACGNSVAVCMCGHTFARATA